MSLEAIGTITAPAQSTIDIDTSLHMHATNPDGSLILSETTGKPITIAQDRRTGNWYALAADSFPFFGNKAQKGGLQDLIDAGGVHVPHDDQRFRGVWVPIAELEAAEYEEEPAVEGKPAVKRAKKKVSR